MAKKLALELVTPEGAAFSGEGDFAVLPAWDGEMGILPGHAAFLVQLKPGEVRFTDHGETRCFSVSGGFVEICKDKVSLFAETAEMADAIDAERARQALERAKAELQSKNLDSMTLAQAEAAMKRAQVRLKVAQMRRFGKK